MPPPKTGKAYVPSRGNVLLATGCIIQPTPTGIIVKVLEGESRKVNFTKKYPWVIAISKEGLPDVTIATL